MSSSRWNTIAVSAAVTLIALATVTHHNRKRRRKKSEHEKQEEGTSTAATTTHPKQRNRGGSSTAASSLSVHEHNGSNTGGRRSRFREAQTHTQVGCAPSTGEFNKCIDKFVHDGDNVLIIRGTPASGAGGQTSSSGDGGEARATLAAKREPFIFQKASVWDSDSLAELHALARQKARPISTICLELSNMHGNDLLFDAMVLIRLLRSLFGGTTESSISSGGGCVILVKSKLLARHARSFHNVHDFINAGGMNNAQFLKSSNGAVQIVGAVGVESYRDTIPVVVREGDRVLEIGCHHGKTTHLLAKAIKADDSYAAVGIDIGKVCIERANKKYGNASTAGSGMNIRFEVADAWDTATLMRYDAGFTVIYVDVGGISGADGEFEALSLVRQLCCAYPSSLRCIVVKSRCLRDHALVWKHSDDILRLSTVPKR